MFRDTLERHHYRTGSDSQGRSRNSCPERVRGYCCSSRHHQGLVASRLVHEKLHKFRPFQHLQQVTRWEARDGALNQDPLGALEIDADGSVVGDVTGNTKDCESQALVAASSARAR